MVVITALDIIRNAIDEITHHDKELSETIIKYFNCCRGRYLTTAGVEE